MLLVVIVDFVLVELRPFCHNFLVLFVLCLQLLLVLVVDILQQLVVPGLQSVEYRGMLVGLLLGILFKRVELVGQLLVVQGLKFLDCRVVSVLLLLQFVGVDFLQVRDHRRESLLDLVELMLVLLLQVTDYCTVPVSGCV